MCILLDTFSHFFVNGLFPLFITTYSVFVGLDKDSYTGHVLVYDIGVNSISLTVIRLINGLMQLVGARTVDGVGGYDIDQELLSVLKDECKRYKGSNIIF